MNRTTTRFLVTAAVMLAVAAMGLHAQSRWVPAPAGDLNGELDADGLAAARPDPCGGCAATVGNCVRVSCSPCCHKCPGFPYLICLQY